MAVKRKSLGGMFSVPPEKEAVTEPEETAARRADRVGKKAILFQAPESAKKQLAILAIEHDKTQQALLSEALNDLFRKYGKEQIA